MSKRRIVVFMAAVCCLGMCCVEMQAQAGPGPSKVTRVRTNLSGFDLAPQTGKSGSTQIGGAARGLGGVTLYAPNSGKAYTTSPVFYWSAGGNGQRIKFMLMDSSGMELYETTVDADHLAYPAEAPGLQTGMTYRWNVKPELDMMSGPPNPISFTIVGGAEREQIKSELQAAPHDVDPELGQVQVYTQHRLWYDTVETYNQLIKSHPEMKILYKQRGTVYDQLPQTQAMADKDFTAAGGQP